MSRKVALEEFKLLQEKVFRAAQRRFRLVPGGSVGKPSGKAEASKLEDFAWGLVIPLISRRAVDLLAQEGIQLRTGNVDLVFRGKRIESHLSLQVEPHPVLTEENLRDFTIVHCSECDSYYQVELKPKVPGGMHIDRTRVPNEDLFMSLERKTVVASDCFIEATRKHGLTGIDFVDCGEYV